MAELRRFSLLIALFAALGLVLAACGSTEFDQAKAEDEAEALVEDENDDAKVDNVKCDDDVEVKKGEEFDCDVELKNGEEVTVEGEIRNDDGDARFRVDGDELAAAVAGGDTGTDTTDTGTDTGSDTGGPATNVPEELESTIRDFQTAVIENDASGACVELSDPALEREFGGFTECLDKFESQAPSGSSTGSDLVIQEVNITGDTATAKVLNPGTGVTSTIKLVDEGGTTGWAIDQL